MKKSFIIILTAFVLAANLFAVQIFAGSDVVVAVIEAEEGKSLESLEAGDIITVSISLPEIDDVTEFALDLSFDESVVRYNGDAALGDFVDGFQTSYVYQMAGEGGSIPTIRFSAAASEPLSFSSGRKAFTASFTVKDGAPSGEAVAFVMENLYCDDDSVSLFKNPLKITVSESETPSEHGGDSLKLPTYIVGVAACAAAVVIGGVTLIKKRSKRA